MEVTVVAEKQGLVIGYLPIDRVAEMPKLAHFSTASAVFKPILRTGSKNSEGDAVLKSSTYRIANPTQTGAGFTVGVISDSVSQSPPGLPNSVALKDLPAGLNVLLDGPAASTDEGRAMLEIVWDIAPGAGLTFSTGSGSPQTFATSITNLFGAGCKVICDDLGYPNTPFFNDGVVGQAIDTVTASGAFYCSAAGNDGNTAWGANWTGMAATVGGIAGTFHDLGGASPFHPISIPAGQTMVLAFQWDAAFLEGGSVLPAFQVANDLAVIITTPADVILVQAFPDNNNLTTDEALEFVVLNNPGAVPLIARISYQLVNGPAPTAIKWVAFTGGGNADPGAPGQANSSAIFGHVAARGAVAVGAVNWSAPTVPETFSSLGGNIPFYFDVAGTRLATAEIRVKPEIAATDGVTTTLASFAPFFGTSAAAPHAAGVAALLWQSNPAATRNQLLAHMQATALDVGAPGVDPLSGSGLLQVTLPLPTVPIIPPGPGPVGPTKIGEGGYVGTGVFNLGGEGGFNFGRAVAPQRPGNPLAKPTSSTAPSNTAQNGLALRGPIADEPGSQKLRMFNISHQATVGNASNGNGSSSSTATNIGLAILVSLGAGGAAIGASRWLR